MQEFSKYHINFSYSGDELCRWRYKDYGDFWEDVETDKLENASLGAGGWPGQEFSRMMAMWSSHSRDFP